MYILMKLALERYKGHQTLAKLLSLT